MLAAKTLRRWVVPGAAISLAVAAIAFLCAMELVQDPEPSTLVKIAREKAPAPKRALTPKPAPKRALRPKQAAHILSPAPRPALRRAPGRVQPGAGKGAGFASAKAADTLFDRLARGEDLSSRLRLLDRELAKLPPESVLEQLEKLLEGVLPGTFQEAEQLRLAVLSRLGRFDEPRANQALVRRLSPELPRPQRLLALELLAARPAVGRPEIQLIASRDVDQVVQKKAAWALQQTP